MHSATSIKLAELAAIRQAKAQLDGRETILLAQLASLPDAPGKEWIREDVAVAMRLAPTTAHHRLHDATELARRFPDTVTAMTRGEFGRYYADRLAEATLGMTDTAASKVEQRVLARAGHQTYTQFTRSLRRAVLRFDTRTAEQATKIARADRRIVYTSRADGVGEIWAQLPLEQMHAIASRVQALADTWKGLDERSVDQRRADAFVRLCLDTADSNGGVRPLVNVVIDIDTLVAAREEIRHGIGSIEGNPVVTALAEALAHDPTGTWRRIVTDPVGQVLDVGRSSYEPTAAITRHVRFRDRTCRFVGCEAGSSKSELDHVWDWDHGGPTADWNLIPLCPRHHHLKHDGGWQVRRLDNGTVRWQSPNGQITERPPDPPPI